MAGVQTIAQTIAQTLVDVKVTEKDNLATALGTYNEADYAADNWAILTGFKTNGDTSIDTATDLAGVSSSKITATDGMAGVQTIAQTTVQTLADAKVTEKDNLATALETYTQSDYTADNWAILTGFKTNGDTSIDVATDLAGVSSSKTTATDGMAGVQTIAQTTVQILADAKVTEKDNLATALETHTEVDYTYESWAALTGFKTEGDTAIDMATDEEDINSALTIAINEMAGVQTIVEENLVVAKAAVEVLTAANYTTVSWQTVTAAMLLPEVTKSEMLAKTLAINNGRAALVLVAQTSGGGGSSSPVISPVVPPIVQPATPPVVQPQTGMDILVNGDTVKAGTVIVTTDTNETVTTIFVDSDKLEQKLALEKDKVVVTIPFVTGSDILISQLNGQMVKSMENKQAIIKITTDTATYTLPALQINIDDVSVQLGKDVKLSDIIVTIEIAKTSAETVKLVENAAQNGQFTILAPPVEFSVRCTYDNKTIDISKFNNYVERMVAIPTDISKNKITTGVVVDADGTVRHVPTKIIIMDGVYYAQINSLTNSTYAVVWNKIAYKDVTKNPAKNAINDLGSRMVISGVKNNLFRPESDITRGEFVAMLVTSLGLAPGTKDIVYSDVKLKDWYCKYIEAANEYGIISGDAKAKFRPKDKITTDEAMTMLTKAMKITGLNVTFKKGEEKKLIASIAKSKQTQVWTDKSIATCIKAGIISIKSKQKIAPKDKITRAEAAIMLRNLLIKSKLI